MFKRTPKYREILAKMGKELPEEVETPKQTSKDDAKVRWLRKQRLYTYGQYLEHLRSGECHRQRVFECPLNCGTAGDAISSKMTYRGLYNHLATACPLIKLECRHCGISE